jgi:ubiquitin carboxyl-terminal hydrolase 4/11/15
LSTAQYPDDEDEGDSSVADSGDADMVLTTSSDADSSGDSKVVANSVDGEDELVDVTMKDAPDAKVSSHNGTSLSVHHQAEPTP